MRRRSFLKLAGLGTLASGIATLTHRATGWWNQPAAEHLEVLSRDEDEIIRSIADAMFPGEPSRREGLPNGADVGLVDHLDGYLAAIDARTSRMFRVLLHLIDELAIPRGLRFQRFRARSRDERIEILKNWDQSSIMVQRSAFRSLKLLLAGGYLNHSDVRETVGLNFRCGGAQ